MRCFYVLVHGTLQWHPSKLATDVIRADRPDGFWCHRFVLAADEKGAVNKTFRRVTDNLDGEFGWLSSGAAKVALEATEVSVAPVHKLLKPDNKGHTFYGGGDGS
jgi:hypothetical protein